MTRLAELTKTPIGKDKRGEPNYWVVRLTDDALFRRPFAMATKKMTPLTGRRRPSLPPR